MLTILQGSDLHYGKPHLARVAAAFHEAVRRAEPDVIVLAGDFTQRAKVREYRQARECLDTLPDVPVIVTPGNHDIPLYRVHERLINPLRNYRTYISSDLDSVTRVEGGGFRGFVLGRAAPGYRQWTAQGQATRVRGTYLPGVCPGGRSHLGDAPSARSPAGWWIGQHPPGKWHAA